MSLTAALFVNTVMGGTYSGMVQAYTKDTSVSFKVKKNFLFSCSNDCLENRIGQIKNGGIMTITP